MNVDIWLEIALTSTMAITKKLLGSSVWTSEGIINTCQSGKLGYYRFMFVSTSEIREGCVGYLKWEALTLTIKQNGQYFV